ncbi:hypothetical protein BVRB_7g164150 isoform B [Beta vulgaris subsp. vulgaris]|nr:hypothetical protein BVRB_7g164150 isoform B [Beta vulgaris subsp. vulgaris]
MGDQAMYSLMIEPVPSNYNLDEQISFAFGFRIRENVVVIYVGIKHCSKLAALLLCICRTCFVIQTEKWFELFISGANVNAFFSVKIFLKIIILSSWSSEFCGCVNSVLAASL